MPRYRFASFVVSPRKRILAEGARELPLIPRYFNLLVFLIAHRHEAVTRQLIFDHVWQDVVVSDSALSQAIRTIRRTLGDSSREPTFVRTVSRHGYRFVFADVIEEPDDESWSVAQTWQGGQPVPVGQVGPQGQVGQAASDGHEEAGQISADQFAPLITRVTATPATAEDTEDQYEAAEVLHALGTAEALRRLDALPRHAYARALLRDAASGTAGAAAVPLLAPPSPFATVGWLIVLRLRRVARLIAARWASASIGGGVAGGVGGAVGGVILVRSPGSAAHPQAIAVLALVGAACGTIGGAGVGAGLAVAEAITRSQRKLALVVCGAIGGAIVGLIVQWLSRWTLDALFGLRVPIGGGFEGLVIAAAASTGYAISTSNVQGLRDGGLAAPRGRRRFAVAVRTGLPCGMAALLLEVFGYPLVGGTIHLIAEAVQGSQLNLAPVGRLIGEPDFGAFARAVIATGEGMLFGFGLAIGLTRRPRRTSG